MAKKKKRRTEKQRDAISQSVLTCGAPERTQPLAIIIGIVTIFIAIIIFMATTLVRTVAIQGEQIEQLRRDQQKDDGVKKRITQLEVQIEYLQEKRGPPETSSETPPDSNVSQSKRPDGIVVHRSK